VSPHFPARLNNCRRQHGALSRSSFSPVVASSCFVCTREPRVRKACGGGLPKLNRNDGNHLKGAWPSKYRPGWCHRLFTVAFFTSCSVTSTNMAGLTVEVQDGAVVQVVRFLRAYWLLILPVAVILRIVYYRYASPLRLYPGPLLASGSRAWKVWSTYSGKTETDHIRLHEKYGRAPFHHLHR
jgi:hypothetical protein